METSDDTDLWWAVRGGGGNTYGVVTQIIYKLHEQPSKFTSIDCTLGSSGKFSNSKTKYLIVAKLEPSV